MVNLLQNKLEEEYQRKKIECKKEYEICMMTKLGIDNLKIFEVDDFILLSQNKNINNNNNKYFNINPMYFGNIL